MRTRPDNSEFLFLFRDPPISGVAWANEWVKGGWARRWAEFSGPDGIQAIEHRSGTGALRVFKINGLRQGKGCEDLCVLPSSGVPSDQRDVSSSCHAPPRSKRPRSEKGRSGTVADGFCFSNDVRFTHRFWGLLRRFLETGASGTWSQRARTLSSEATVPQFHATSFASASPPGRAKFGLTGRRRRMPRAIAESPQQRQPPAERPRCPSLPLPP